MEFTEDAERGDMPQIEDVVIGMFQRRAIVEHQQDAGDGFNEEEKESDTAHAPGIR